MPTTKGFDQYRLQINGASASGAGTLYCYSSSNFIGQIDFYPDGTRIPGDYLWHPGGTSEYIVLGMPWSRFDGVVATVRTEKPLFLYIDALADIEDVTLFGAWGPIEHGHQQLVDTFRWVGRRFTGGALVPEDTVVYASGDLAYTVGFERGEVSVDGGPPQPMIIRVTHIYRRIDGDWRVVHRHADFPPPDQRQGMR